MTDEHEPDGLGPTDGDGLLDRLRVLAATAAGDPTDEEVLDALARLAGVRRELDRIERHLLESARAHGTSWARIAGALGLVSRQAAEQRWLRLCAERTRDPGQQRVVHSRLREQDRIGGPPIRRLRAGVLAAERVVGEDPGWDARHPRAVLVRTSLEAAARAVPSALVALASLAVDDLQAMGATALPANVRTSLDQLTVAVGQIRHADR